MNASKGPKNPFSVQARGGNGWLLILGDLLTLLLTFFVSFLLFREPQDEGKNANNARYQVVAKSDQEVVGPAQLGEGLGTPIAMKEGEKGPESLSFVVVFQAKEVGTKKSKAWQSLERAANSGIYELRSLSLQGCGGRLKTRRQADYQKMLATGLQLQRRIIDAKWSPEKLSFEMDERVCNENSVSHSKQNARALQATQILVFGRLEQKERIQKVEYGSERRRTRRI